MAAALLLPVTTGAQATVLDDPLHMTCLVGCVSNGTTIDIGNPPLNWGFQASPDQPVPGALTVDFLVPTTAGIIPSIQVTGSMFGALSFTATLFSTDPWTASDKQALEEYLGINASPTNSLTAFLNSDAGYYVCQGFAGSYALPQQGTPLSDGTTPLWSVLGGVPFGTGITGFFNDGSGTLVATATSSSLHAVPGPIVGAGLVPWLLGSGCFGMFGLNRWRKRRRVA